VEDSLRALREATGFTALDIATHADCPVEVVLRAEFGLSVPLDRGLRGRLAAAYGVSVDGYLRLALDAAEQAAGTHWMAAEPGHHRSRLHSSP